MLNGVINIYKEKGYTSHDVVAKLRGILKQKKIGHTGTLDPDAEGVLPVCLGSGTKLCDMLTDKNKTYEAVLLLGISTDTQDSSGEILKTKLVESSCEEIEKTILGFVGEYFQLPPMYSAIKVNGKKLYELAREGIEIPREKRKVCISEIKIKEYNEIKHEITMEVNCSKGTYIRTLCHDIGEALGCGGCMKYLLRTKVGQFHIENSVTLDQISEIMKEGSILDHMILVEDMFLHYNKIIVKEEDSKLVYNGNIITTSSIAKIEEGSFRGKQEEADSSIESLVRIYDFQNKFIGIYEYNNLEELYKPRKMFL